MTFQEFMLQVGYETKTTFWDDFSIADRFGLDAIKDTYERAFDEWKNNRVYTTELVMVLNHKIWQWYESDKDKSFLYDQLWKKADAWCMDNLKGEDLQYFLETTD